VLEARFRGIQEPERKALEQKPTGNMLAYEIYLRGLAHAHRPSSREEDFLNAIRLFEQAVQLDPDFALAYARLSTVHSELVFWGFDPSEQRIAQAKAAADRALQLQPDLPEAHRALGTYYYDCFFDYDRALKELSIAAKGLPNDPEILEMIAYIWRRQGLVDDAIVNLQRAADLDPRNAWLKMQLGFCYECTKRYAEADRYLDESIALDPDQSYVYFFKAQNHFLWDGDLAKARAAVAAAPKQGDPLVAVAGWQVKMALGKYQEALDRASALPDGISGGRSVVVRDLMIGMAHHQLGHDEQARAAFESARTDLETLIVENPTLAEAYTVLGLTYALLGHMEEAIRTGRQGVDLVKDDAVRLAPCQVDLIKTLIVADEHESALDLIEQVLAQQWTTLSPHLLSLDHAYDPLRDNPRFQRLVATVE